MPFLSIVHWLEGIILVGVWSQFITKIGGISSISTAAWTSINLILLKLIGLTLHLLLALLFVYPIRRNTLLAHSLLSLKELAVAFLCFINIPVPMPMTMLVPIGVPLDLMARILSCRWQSSFSPNKGSFPRFLDGSASIQTSSPTFTSSAFILNFLLYKFLQSLMLLSATLYFLEALATQCSLANFALSSSGNFWYVPLLFPSPCCLLLSQSSPNSTFIILGEAFADWWEPGSSPAGHRNFLTAIYCNTTTTQWPNTCLIKHFKWVTQAKFLRVIFSWIAGTHEIHENLNPSKLNTHTVCKGSHHALALNQHFHCQQRWMEHKEGHW